MLARGSPDVIIEGEVLEVDAPRGLVQTWNPLFDAQITAEAVTRLTFETEDAETEGVTKLTLTHELDGARPRRSSAARSRTPAAGGPSSSAT